MYFRAKSEKRFDVSGCDASVSLNRPRQLNIILGK